MGLTAPFGEFFWFTLMSMTCFAGLFDVGARRQSLAVQGSATRDRLSECAQGCLQGWPQLRRSLCPKGSGRVEAQQLVDELLDTFQRAAALDLPSGAAATFAKLRQNIAEVEDWLKEAKQQAPRAWLLSQASHAQLLSGQTQPEEPWEITYPLGGKRLRRQMCMASRGDGAWFVGGLSISDVGLVFDSRSVAAGFCTGLLHWRDVVHLKRSKGERGKPSSEMTFKLADHVFGSKLLVLQLSIQEDAEWIEEFWKIHVDNKESSQYSIPSEFGGPLLVPLKSTAPRLLLSTREGAAREGPHTFCAAASSSATTSVSQRSLSSSPRLQRGPTADGFQPCSHARDDDKAEAEEPTACTASTESEEAPEEPSVPEAAGSFDLFPATEDGLEPLCVQALPGLDLETMQRALQHDNFILEFFKAERAARNERSTGWCRSNQTPGAWITQLDFTMQLPNDVPAAVTRLINLPTHSPVTVIGHLYLNGTELLLRTQSHLRDVPFGNNFRVQECVKISSSPQGYELRKFCRVHWIETLPWTLGIVRMFLESRARQDSVKGVPSTVRLLHQLGEMSRVSERTRQQAAQTGFHPRTASNEHGREPLEEDNWADFDRFSPRFPAIYAPL